MQTHHVTLDDGIIYHYVEWRPTTLSNKPTLLCLHGFPDQWYGWKKQAESWANNGYRVIIPHMLGYGQTSKPVEAEKYSPKSISFQIAALLDKIGLERVVLLSHDWGAAIAWRFALWNPHRLLALVTMSVPFFPPSKRYVSPSEASKRVPAFAYQEYFADPISTREIEASLDVFLPVVFQAPTSEASGFSIPLLKGGEARSLIVNGKSNSSPLPMVISPEQLEIYKSDFKRDGMHGPLSYYRNTRTRYEEEKDRNLALPSNLPILFMYGTLDSTCPSAYAERMKSLRADLTIIPLEDTGHWVLLERPDRITEEVLRFLQRVEASGKGTALASARL